MGHHARRGDGSRTVTDDEREALRARIRRTNRDSSGDRSGKRGPLARFLARVLPPTGRRRKRRHRHHDAAPAEVPEQPPRRHPLPVHRSPYAAEHARTTLDGPLARPYLLAYERDNRQAIRRLALELALDGVDIGPTVIHGVRPFSRSVEAP